MCSSGTAVSVSYPYTNPTKRVGLVQGMVFNATVNNVSFISWRSVLLMEETGVLRENHRPAASH